MKHIAKSRDFWAFFVFGFLVGLLIQAVIMKPAPVIFIGVVLGVFAFLILGFVVAFIANRIFG